MGKVFISYSRKDKEDALKLVNELRNRHFEIWFDESDIKTGDQWEDRIMEGLETCSAFVIINTPRAARSPWVMRELSYAVEFKKPIIPWLLEGDLLPLCSDSQCARTIDDILHALTRLTQIVICHVTEDAEFVTRLKTDLANLGANIWQDHFPHSQDINANGETI